MSRMLQMAIQVSADDCYARFCNAERLAEWVPNLLGVEVLRRDEDELPLEIRFRVRDGEAERVYSVLYAYDKNRRRVTWQPGSEPGYAVRGFASFDRNGAHGCRMIYSLNVGEARDDSPGDGVEVATQSLEAFKQWVEKG